MLDYEDVSLIVDCFTSGLHLCQGAGRLGSIAQVWKDTERFRPPVVEAESEMLGSTLSRTDKLDRGIFIAIQM